VSAFEERSMDAIVKVSKDRGTGRVVLARPDVHNAFNDEVVRAVTGAFEALGHAADVRAIVLAGEGKSFCAGADLHWMKRMVEFSFDENVKDAEALARMIRTIHDCPKPVIARVHGAALGGGVGLVAAADLAVAVRSATFALSEVRLGLLPAVVSPFVLEKIGASAGRRYFLTAERFDAEEAKRIGLVCEVVADEEALDRWIERAIEAIAANGPEAIAACKKLIDDVWGPDWNDLARRTAREIAARRASAEGQEGMKAFLEKRPPAWTRRS
jgi:methylglutaconyl-CoA hydratase